jgi:hypothetical protein
MRRIIKISKSETIPSQTDTFLLQGIPRHTRPKRKIVSIFKAAEKLFQVHAEPAGIVADISKSEFAEVYRGESRNEKRSPVAEISERADHLALFAVTIGQVVSDKINELFEHEELTLGVMLDAVASAAVEMATDTVAKNHIDRLQQEDREADSAAVLRYSPGYCGWHISGQKKLFEFLRPGEIGITLLGSFLMTPLKSISGVLLTGKKEIHIFEDNYSFCRRCKMHSCQQRIRKMLTEFGSVNNSSR